MLSTTEPSIELSTFEKEKYQIENSAGSNPCPIIGFTTEEQYKQLTALYGLCIVTFLSTHAATLYNLPSDVIGVIFSFFCKDYGEKHSFHTMRMYVRYFPTYYETIDGPRPNTPHGFRPVPSRTLERTTEKIRGKSMRYINCACKAVTNKIEQSQCTINDYTEKTVRQKKWFDDNINDKLELNFGHYSNKNHDMIKDLEPQSVINHIDYLLAENSYLYDMIALLEEKKKWYKLKLEYMEKKSETFEHVMRMNYLASSKKHKMKLENTIRNVCTTISDYVFECDKFKYIVRNIKTIKWRLNKRILRAEQSVERNCDRRRKRVIKAAFNLKRNEAIVQEKSIIEKAASVEYVTGLPRAKMKNRK
jgi:hypothetical protein